MSLIAALVKGPRSICAPRPGASPAEIRAVLAEERRVAAEANAKEATRQARVAWQRDYSAGLSFQLNRPGKFTDFAARG